MKISDEIRGVVNIVNYCGLKGQEWGDKFTSVADRIDREMVELPRDRDGVPIHVGDTVYLDNGSKADVESIQFNQDENSVVFIVRGRGFFPTSLTHKRPDSLGRIADELDEWRVAASEDCRIKAIDEDIVRDLAERSRKLAKEGEHGR